MIRLPLRPQPTGGSPPGPRRSATFAAENPRRHNSLHRLGLVAALGLSVVAACAFSVPGSVFGAAEPPVPAGVTGTEPSSPDPSAGSVLVTLPWGGGPGQVGLVRPVEGLTRGPEALAVSPDGRIAVLDSVNGRLVLLNAEGCFENAVPLPLAEPRFLALDDKTIYVLDCDADRRVMALDWSGNCHGAAALPALTDVVTGLFATEAGPCVEVAHESTLVLLEESLTGAAQAPASGSAVADTGEAVEVEPSQRSLVLRVAGRPVDRSLGSAVQVTFRPQQGMRVTSYALQGNGLSARKVADVSPNLGSAGSVDQIEHLVSVDGDGTGGLVVGAHLLEPEMPDASWKPLLLSRYGSQTETEPVATLALSESSFAYLGQPYVVGPDGRVYQPVGSETGYSILVHSLGGQP